MNWFVTDLEIDFSPAGRYAIIWTNNGSMNIWEQIPVKLDSKCIDLKWRKTYGNIGHFVSMAMC